MSMFASLMADAMPAMHESLGTPNVFIYTPPDGGQPRRYHAIVNPLSAGGEVEAVGSIGVAGLVEVERCRVSVVPFESATEIVETGSGELGDVIWQIERITAASPYNITMELRRKLTKEKPRARQQR